MATAIGNREALLVALESISRYESLRPEEFTVSDFVRDAAAEGKKLGRRRAQENLNALVDKGKLVCRSAIIKGRVANAYSLP